MVARYACIGEWLHFEMIVSQIKDIIIESGSHTVMGRVLTLILSRLSVGRRVVSFGGLYLPPPPYPRPWFWFALGF